MSTPATTPTPASRSTHARSGNQANTGTRAGTESTSHSNSNSNSGRGPESLSQLEREVLDEYGHLLENLNELSPLLANLSTNPTAQVLDTLRVLERKASLVSTLLKASVYSIVLQQQMLEGEEQRDEDFGDGGYRGRGGEVDGESWAGSE